MISISNLGTLLYEMGQLEEARPLLEEALQAQRETLGHHSTLISIGNMGQLLQAMGKLEVKRRCRCSRRWCRDARRRWATATHTR